MSSKTITTGRRAGASDVEVIQKEEVPGDRLRSSCSLPSQNSFAISPTDIEFFNIAPNVVAVQIKVTNDSDMPSTPDTLEIRAAPFGAFVPWQNLAAVALPTLVPGMTRYVRWWTTVPRPEPLGNPDGLGPRDLLTAFGLADEPPDKAATQTPEQARQPATNKSSPAAAPMPPGLLDLLLQETPHWAGNINVLVGSTDVERHRGRHCAFTPVA